MKTTELDYKLDKELIAQEPIEPRDTSRLLVLNKKTGKTTHRRFFEIGDYLKGGDLLVVNNTKVLPARLIGKKEDTGAKVEILLLAKVNDFSYPTLTSHLSPLSTWEVLAKPAKRLKVGTKIIFGKELKAEVIEVKEEGKRIVKFICNRPLNEVLHKIGKIPLPPYITKPLDNKERYQTIYAKKEDSAAAPTAGLHFTKNLISSLKDKGIKFADVNLAIGLDTFQPIRESEVEKHHIHSEYFQVSQKTANLIKETKENNGRIIAVGTTSTRVLETLAGISATNAEEGYTNIYIYPGYKFKIVDAMITNFHLPKTTLLAMVSAFAGVDKINKAYTEAIQKKYRFYSFGDAMFIF